jgi:hypothetical protein
MYYNLYKYIKNVFNIVQIYFRQLLFPFITIFHSHPVKPLKALSGGLVKGDDTYRSIEISYAFLSSLETITKPELGYLCLAG